MDTQTNLIQLSTTDAAMSMEYVLYPVVLVGSNRSLLKIRRCLFPYITAIFILMNKKHLVLIQGLSFFL